MSDSTSAGIFWDVFAWLAEQPETIDRNAAALHFWKLSREYDFSDYSLDGESMEKLNLADHRDDPNDGARYAFGPPGERR